MTEIIRFREMLENRISRRDPPLPAIPDEHKPLIAKLAHERHVSPTSLAQPMAADPMDNYVVIKQSLHSQSIFAANSFRLKMKMTSTATAPTPRPHCPSPPWRLPSSPFSVARTTVSMGPWVMQRLLQQHASGDGRSDRNIGSGCQRLSKRRSMLGRLRGLRCVYLSLSLVTATHLTGNLGEEGPTNHV